MMVLLLALGIAVDGCGCVTVSFQEFGGSQQREFTMTKERNIFSWPSFGNKARRKIWPGG
jgi:hypothetical protein